MRSGRSSWRRFTSSRSPSSSLPMLKRSPLGRTATSRLRFETSIPTLLTMTFVLLDDGFSLPCVASTLWLLQVSGLFRRLPRSDPCSWPGFVSPRACGLLHGRFLTTLLALPQVRRAGASPRPHPPPGEATRERLRSIQGPRAQGGQSRRRDRYRGLRVSEPRLGLQRAHRRRRAP